MGRISGDGEKEIESLRKDKKRARVNGNLAEEAKIADELGQALSLQERYEEAIDEHLDDLNLRNSLSDTLGQAIANRRIGECYTELKLFKEALRYLDEYLRLSRQCCSLVEEQRSWATLGRTYLIQGEETESVNNTRKCWARAENAFMKSLEVCQSLEGDVSARELCQMKARLHLNLGLMYDNRRNLVKAAEHFKESASLSSVHGLDEDLYRAQSGLTLTLMRMPRDQWTLADETACLALNTAQQLKKRSIQAEAHLNIAKVKLLLRNFMAAKKSLKKAHELSAKEDKPSFWEVLKQVFRLERLHQAFTNTVDPEEKMKFLEKMADKAASYHLYHLALALYAETLKLCQELQKPARLLAPLYYSLGQTYADDLQHDLAIKYFRAELQCQADEPTKACRTLLRIALEQENAGKNYDTVRDTYLRALNQAERSLHIKLQAQCHRYLVQLQQANHQPTDSTQLELLVDEYHLDLDELSDEDYSQDKDELQCEDSDGTEEEIEVDLDEIADSDVEEECGRTQNGAKRPSRSFPVKKNAKGESLLHVACIEGNIRKVKTLIQKGHPLSVQDNCGWTPLHEACNHGHLEIVDLLLNKGANINDPGGPMTDGITPLHDACTAGNVEVIEMLIDKGANLFTQDKAGNTPLDTLRDYCRRSDPQELTTEQRMDIRRVQSRLFQLMTGKALKEQEYFIQSNILDELPSFTRDPRRQRQTRRLSHSPSDSESAGPDFESFQGDSEPILDPNNARDVYRTVIKSMGSSAQRLASRSKPVEPMNKLSHSALVDSSQYLDDDWLIEDVREPIKRRRPTDIDAILPSITKKRKTDSAKKLREKENAAGNERKNERYEGLGDQRTHFDEPTVMASPANSNGKDGMVDDNSFLDICVETEWKKDRKDKQAKITQYAQKQPISAGDSGYISARAAAGSLCPVWISAEDKKAGNNDIGPTRLRIRVLGESMVVPVSTNDTTRTIGWLCEQISQRYCAKHGRRPQLCLQTIDGASIANDDIIKNVIQPDEDLTAVAEAWSVRGLAACYEDACASTSSVTHRNVKSRLDQSTPAKHLVLSGMELRPDQMRPVFMALQPTNIHTLQINGNRVDSSVLDDVVACLNGLTVLDLRACSIDHTGFNKLISGLKRSEARNSLTSINMSYNSLTDACTPSLIELLDSSHKLSDLALSSCRLTSQFISTRGLALITAFEQSRLECLNVSNNRLGREGVRVLLRALPCSVKSLDLARTTDGLSVIDISDDLYEFVVRNRVEELNVTGCRLTEKEVDDLIRAVPQCGRLTTLQLSCNIISYRQIQQLFANSADARLESLELLCCGLCGPLDALYLDCMMTKMGSANPLQKFIFTCLGISRIDSDSLIQIWNTVWRERAKTRVSKDKITLWIA